MVHLTLLLTVLLVPITWCYSEEIYPLSDNLDNSYLYPDNELDNDLDVRRRNSNFLRFGRNDPKIYDLEFDDFNEAFARPTRSENMDKSDHFIRFGRGKTDFLRFGRNIRRGDDHIRFGRSIPENKRNKREVFSEFDNKRGGSNFMRFGRNGNFLRFGRRENDVITTANPGKNHQFSDSPLIQLLAQLVENIKKEQSKLQNLV